MGGIGQGAGGGRRQAARVALAVMLCIGMSGCSSETVVAGAFVVDAGHAAASDDNPGTPDAPWRTLQAAADKLEAGQTAVVRPGIYRGEVRFARSGRPGAPIVLRAAPGAEHRAILDGREGDARILLDGVSHIRIEGLRVQHAPGVAIDIRGPGEDIAVINNWIYDSFSSAIGAWGTPWKSDPSDTGYRNLRNIVIRGNKIQLAVNGGWNEQITVANGVDGVEISGNELWEKGDTTNGGEGIDLKAGVSNARIFGNTIRDIGRMGIYLDAAGVHGHYAVPPVISNVEIFDNRILDQTGTGITIGTEGQGSVRGVRIYNNVIANAGIQGILVYLHPRAAEWGEGPPGTVSDVQIFNNTVSGSERYGLLVNFAGATDITVANNISVGNGYGQVSIQTPGKGVEAFGNVTEDARFVAPRSHDYRLRSGSPAIDAAMPGPVADRDAAGTPRPQGRGVDAGAYEFTP